jgi:hypothetical protein
MGCRPCGPRCLLRSASSIYRLALEVLRAEDCFAAGAGGLAESQRLDWYLMIRLLTTSLMTARSSSESC